MPIRPPGLDDRRFTDLVSELVARIPAHTPEWSNPQPGDPGYTLIDLFAWLGDALLYRANLIPERQRLAFLRLLGEQMRPALPARTLISLGFEEETKTDSVVIRPQATVKGPVNFETLSELTILPISAEAYYKRPLTADESQALDPVIQGLRTVYGITGNAQPYQTAPLFAGGVADPAGFDITQQSVDKALWLALLAPKPESVDAVRKTLGVSASGGQQLLSIGVQPTLTVPDLFEEVGQRGRIPQLWEVCSRIKSDGEVEYMALDVISDSSVGLTRRGVVRVALPAERFLQRPPNDVRLDLAAGVGDKPPRLDDPDKANRLVTWLRLRPLGDVQQMQLSWIGVNAVEIDQRQTLGGRVIGQSDASANQQFQLPAASVESATLQIEVEEPGLGYRPWQPIDDLALAGRDDSVYSLDAEAGTIQFGDNVRGRIPAVERRIRVAMMRSGGGAAGNLLPNSLTAITAFNLAGKPVSKLKVSQPLTAEGGENAETLAAAEQRIPALFRHRDRCITSDDYKRLAADTPGVRVGRVEVLPQFRPQQRQPNVLGVVSVMVLPFQEAIRAPNPRADRPFLESVYAWLDARRPLGTELYVIGCEYIPLGISVGVSIGDGFGQEMVLSDVREALRRFLWSLNGGGILGTGWPLGGDVRGREVEVAVARVPGVISVRGVNLFERNGEDWRLIPAQNGDATLTIEDWQLPELLSVVAVADQAPPDTLSGVPNPFATGVAVPVVPDLCK